MREAVGHGQGSLEMPDSVHNVEQLIAYLISESSIGHGVLEDEAQVLIAVNQTVVDRKFPLTGDEEVAFFPPMTGG